MFAKDLPLGRHHDPLGVDPDADRAVGKGCRDAVPIAFKADEADRGHPLGVFDKTIEGPPQRHQTTNLSGVYIGYGAGQVAMLDLTL
jgi:hypothetical protein